MASSKSLAKNGRKHEDRQKAANDGLFPIAGIGASAGGLEALTQFLKEMPEDTGMAFVVVQHLAPKHKSLLVELLARATKIPVVKATEGKRVDPNHIYVIPPDTEMLIADGMLSLRPRDDVHNGPPLPIDSFLHSLAEDRRNLAIGIILSGSASDGTLGLKAIKAAGGITFAQDERSAKFSSMPHSAIRAGYVDFVLPPQVIARELGRISRHPYLTPAAPADPEEPSFTSYLGQAFVLLRAASGVDFGHYKQTTVLRRINRRMVVHNIEDLAGYVRLLRGNPAEVQALYQDLLINVTSFFREPEAFEYLKRKTLPQLMVSRSSALRIWVPGCSTGEEAYSLAMCVMEYLSSAQSDIPLQVLATDISESALQKARRGRYAESDLAGISPERLSRFFTQTDSGFQVIEPVREACIFARQNITRDPPFSRLDLISCRNLLIYLDRSMQRKLVPIFHFALQPNGFLMLGRSESISEFSELFRLVDKKNRVYAKSTKTAARPLAMESAVAPAKQPESMAISRAASPEFDLQKQMERMLLTEYTPACVVVNEDLEIVQFHGHTGAYLDPTPGAASLRLFKMARAGLPLELRTALDLARKTGDPVIRRGIRVPNPLFRRGPRAPEVPAEHEVTLEVRPLKASPSDRHYYIVLFHEEPEKAKGHRPPPGGEREGEEASELKRQLTVAKFELQDIIEQLENTNEQLRAANEEVQSNNEELQTTNEELETAKEELQATNEELTTLNEELQNRNSELTVTNSDLNNVISNIAMPMVVLSGDLRIRRYTSGAKKIFNLIPSDVGRPLTDLRCCADFPGLETMVTKAAATLSTHEQEIPDRQGHWYSIRVRPYRTVEDRIEGAVITLLDIKNLKAEVTVSNAYAALIVETMMDPVMVLDQNLIIKGANQAFYNMFQVSSQETEDKALTALGNGQWDIPRLTELLREILPEKRRVNNFLVEHNFPVIGPRSMLLNARQFVESHEAGAMILLVIRDITDWNRAQHLVKEQAMLLDLSNDVIIVRNIEGLIYSWNMGAERTYGWTRAEAVGKTTHELLRTIPEDAIKVQRESLLASGSWEGELRHMTREGKPLTMSSHQVLQRNSAGEPVSVLEINRDVTRRKVAQEQLEAEKRAISELSARILQLQDEERGRIARELHDSTAQTLAALGMNLSLIEAKLPAADPEVAQELRESRALASQASDEIRNLSHLLYPPDLENMGLVAAIRWFAAQFAKHSKIKVTLDLKADSKRWPAEIEIALFRVTQESLMNVQRHSGSQTASVQLLQRDGDVVLSVADKGRGVPGGHDGVGSPPIGVGVMGMRERLRQLGGQLKFAPTPKGTTVTAAVPLRASKPA